MRTFLIASLLGAVLAVGAVLWELRPGRGAPPPAPDRLVTRPPRDAEGSPVRTIPLSGAAPAARPPRGEAAAPAAGPASGQAAQAPGPVAAADPQAPDPAAQAPPPSTGAGLTPAQVDALRRQAARRQVRPVTRMSFPLEPGASVPPQVYLHPLPPDADGLAAGADRLGFIVVGDRYVVVDADRRTVVAVGG